MEEFILASSPELKVWRMPPDYDPCVKVLFGARKYDAEGFLTSYQVELKGRGLHASFPVDHEFSPSSPATLLQRVAANAKGWKGVERWHAYEGELEINAESSPSGRVHLGFHKPETLPPTDWSASVWIAVESGQLEHLAREAKAFFDSKQ